MWGRGPLQAAAHPSPHQAHVLLCTSFSPPPHPSGVRLRPSCGLSNDCEMRYCTQQGSHSVGRSEDAGFLTSPVCSLPPLFSPLCRENHNTCVKIACCFLVSFSNLEETVFPFPSCPSLSLCLLHLCSPFPFPSTMQGSSWPLFSQDSQG